jgi:hypothetical protein
MPQPIMNKAIAIKSTIKYFFIKILLKNLLKHIYFSNQTFRKANNVPISNVLYNLLNLNVKISNVDIADILNDIAIIISNLF